MDTQIRCTLFQRIDQHGSSHRRSRRTARIMARKYGDQSFKEGEKDDISDEITDVLWVLLCIANQTGVNLTEAFARNLEKKTQRDNKRHINNPKLSEHGNE